MYQMDKENVQNVLARETSSARTSRTFSIVEETARGDVIETATASETGLLQFLREAFLPTGYPATVSQDYVAYQIYDTAQAFCSSITGLLSTRAMLKGVGVGDASATATSALIVRVIHETTGRVGTILFAWKLSGHLDSDCKTWRLAADIFNDLGMICDIIAPTLPRSFFLYLTCIGTLFRALTGVAGGATRAALTQHFAIKDNMADVSAKDASQETIVSLTGMLFGTVLVTRISESLSSTWLTFWIFTILHLLANYMAVRSVTLNTFNRQRASLVIQEYLWHNKGEILTPKQVAQRERIFGWPGERGGRIEIGTSLTRVIEFLKGDHQSPSTLLSLFAVFTGEDYVLSISAPRPPISGPHSRHGAYVRIAFHELARPEDTLRAYFHACLLLEVRERAEEAQVAAATTSTEVKTEQERAVKAKPVDLEMLVEETLLTTQEFFDTFTVKCKRAGWNVERGMVEGMEEGWKVWWKEEANKE